MSNVNVSSIENKKKSITKPFAFSFSFYFSNAVAMLAKGSRGNLNFSGNYIRMSHSFIAANYHMNHSRRMFIFLLTVVISKNPSNSLVFLESFHMRYVEHTQHNRRVHRISPNRIVCVSRACIESKPIHEQRMREKDEINET